MLHKIDRNTSWIGSIMDLEKFLDLKLQWAILQDRYFTIIYIRELNPFFKKSDLPK